MTGNTYLEIKLLKNLFSKLFATMTKALGKRKTPKNFPTRKPTLPFNLITLNISNSFNLAKKFWSKIQTPYFLYNNLYLHFLRKCNKNIFKIVCIVSEKKWEINLTI